MGLAPMPRWSIQGNWSHVDARYDNYQQGGVSLVGKRPTNTPASVLNLWTSYRITPALEVNASCAAWEASMPMRPTRCPGPPTPCWTWA